jgi:hypothetical protein
VYLGPNKMRVVNSDQLAGGVTSVDRNYEMYSFMIYLTTLVGVQIVECLMVR